MTDRVRKKTMMRMLLKTSEAAQRLGLSSRHVRRLIAEGRLREVARGVLVEADVNHLRAATSGRRRRGWDAVTAWAAIDLVTGGTGDLVGPTQRSRLRGKIRQLTAQDFVSAAAGRVRTLRFDTRLPELSDAIGWVVPLQPHPQPQPRQPSLLDAYAAPSHLERLIDRLQLMPDLHGYGRVTLRLTAADYGLLRVLTGRGSFLAAVDHASDPEPAMQADALRKVATGLAAYRAGNAT